MNEKDIITAAMKSCGWTQAELAKKAGYKTQSAISNRINGKSLRVDTFVKLLTAMGYKVVVMSTSPNTNKNKWVVSDDTKTETDEIDSDILLADDEPTSATQPEKTKGRIKMTK